MQQEEAFDILKMGKNVFLTGAAGAGKTFLLNKYIRYLKDCDVKVAITASTGIAATHLQGNTIHSWSGIGVRDSINNKDLEKILSNSRIKRNYKKTKVLIIDEVSMLHGYQLEMVDKIARFVLEKDEPFGGIQVVLCGDFFQLPPVGRSFGEEETLFAFESEAWKEGDFHICYLYEQHRQKNDPLLDVLNDIRSGTAGEHTKIPLRTRYKKEPEGNAKATKLYSKNINVDYINEAELAAITGMERSFDMDSSGFGALVDGLKKSCMAPEKLKLKVGAEVMFVKNDQLGSYVNGTRGVIVSFEREKGFPVVKTYNGDIIVARPEEWKYEDNGVVRATISQVPLRLAWAITIHKSQGMTLDAAEMDLGDTFEPGMGYVALSRVRSLNGLKLMNLNEMALKVNERILSHDKFFKAESDSLSRYLKKIPDDEKMAMHKETLFKRFNGYEYGGMSVEKVKEVKKERAEKEKKTATHLVTLDFIKENIPLKDIASQRGYTIGTIVGHIEKLKGLKIIDNAQIDYIKTFLPANDFKEIFKELKNSDDGALKPVYEKFDGKYSYDDIRIVRIFAA